MRISQPIRCRTLRAGLLALSLFGLAATPGLALTQAPAAENEYLSAVAAGYKSLELCSGQFDAGRSADAIAQDELSRIYKELRDPIANLSAMTDPGAKTVTTPYAKNLPPRIAAWRPVLGCTLLPIGAPAASLRALPRITAAAPDYSRRPWPLGDQAATASLPRLAQARLDVPVALAFDRKTYGLGTETTAVIVVKRGKIVAEHYRLGFDANTSQRTWSVAKTLSAALLSIAAERKIVDLNTPAPVPEWRRPGDPRAAISLDNLLRMASGLYSGPAGNRTDAAYFGGSTVAETAAVAPMAARPGQRWEYANNDILLAVHALRTAIGDDQRFWAFPYETLFWRIGMTHTYAETDWAGDFVLSSQVYSTARDLARFGLLLLARGRFGADQILSGDSVAAMIAPSGPQPLGEKRPGYGRGTWLFGPAQGLPSGTFAAQGNRGQYVVIVPSEDLVIVRRGFDAVGDGQPFDIARFAADVIGAAR